MKIVPHKVGQAFEYDGDGSNKMRASALFQSAENSYLRGGQRQDVKRVRIKRIETIEASIEEMQQINISYTITKEEMDKCITGMVRENPIQSLANIANQFAPSKVTIEWRIYFRILSLSLFCRKIIKPSPSAGLIVIIPMGV